MRVRSFQPKPQKHAAVWEKNVSRHESGEKFCFLTSDEIDVKNFHGNLKNRNCTKFTENLGMIFFYSDFISSQKPKLFSTLERSKKNYIKAKLKRE